MEAAKAATIEDSRRLKVTWLRARAVAAMMLLSTFYLPTGDAAVRSMSSRGMDAAETMLGVAPSDDAGRRHGFAVAILEVLRVIEGAFRRGGSPVKGGAGAVVKVWLVNDVTITIRASGLSLDIDALFSTNPSHSQLDKDANIALSLLRDGTLRHIAAPATSAGIAATASPTVSVQCWVRALVCVLVQASVMNKGDVTIASVWQQVGSTPFRDAILAFAHTGHPPPADCERSAPRRNAPRRKMMHIGDADAVEDSVSMADVARLFDDTDHEGDKSSARELPSARPVPSLAHALEELRAYLLHCGCVAVTETFAKEAEVVAAPSQKRRRRKE
jgi:hypothetical protein